VGPRASVDVVEKRKIPNPHQELNPRTPIVQPVGPQKCVPYKYTGSVAQ